VFSVEVDAYRATLRLDSLPDKVRAALSTKRDALLSELTLKAKELAPVGKQRTGGAGKVHTAGQLRRSIFSKREDTATSVGGLVATGASTPYARIQELGGKTAAHEIVAKGKALAFLSVYSTRPDMLFFVKRVHHPGSTIVGQFYMKRAFDSMSEQIVAELTEAARGAGA
jgi:phage gpG-like protein